jgi:hypothetical protein
MSRDMKDLIIEKIVYPVRDVQVYLKVLHIIHIPQHSFMDGMVLFDKRLGARNPIAPFS